MAVVHWNNISEEVSKIGYLCATIDCLMLLLPTGKICLIALYTINIEGNMHIYSKHKFPEHSFKIYLFAMSKRKLKQKLPVEAFYVGLDQLGGPLQYSNKI